MTDAITPITSTTSFNYEQVSPADLEDFENAYEGEEIQFSSINSVDKPEAIDLSDRLFQTVMEIDEGYHRVFSKNDNIFSELNALQNQKIEHDDVIMLSDSPEKLFEKLDRFQNLLTEARSLSLKTELLVTTASSITKGLGMLLKG